MRNPKVEECMSRYRMNLVLTIMQTQAEKSSVYYGSREMLEIISLNHVYHKESGHPR